MERTTAQLKSFNDANITTNGVNSNTGANHNTMNNDMIDSLVNKSSDALSIVTNVYRSNTIAVTTSQTQVTFSSALVSNNYEVVINDPDGVGWENITDKQTTGFKITGLSSGTLIYFVILNN